MSNSQRDAAETTIHHFIDFGIIRIIVMCLHFRDCVLSIVWQTAYRIEIMENEFINCQICDLPQRISEIWWKTRVAICGFELANAVGLDPNDLSHPYYWAPFILIGNGL